MELLVLILMLVGLGLGLCGAILLYKSAVPLKLNFVILGKIDKNKPPVAGLKQSLAKRGIFLIFIGFVVQLVAVLIQLVIQVIQKHNT